MSKPIVKTQEVPVGDGHGTMVTQQAIYTPVDDYVTVQHNDMEMGLSGDSWDALVILVAQARGKTGTFRDHLEKDEITTDEILERNGINPADFQDPNL